MKNKNTPSIVTPSQDPLFSFFQEIGNDIVSPEDLKEGVFKSLVSIQLVMNIADLFTVKFTKSETMLLDITQNKEEK